MVDVLLVQPPIRDFYLTSKRTIPYGLTSIAASLQNNGFSVEIIDALAVSKSRIIDWPDEMHFLSPYYGKEDLSPFGLFHHFRHYGYSFQHIAKLVKASEACIVGISSLFTAYSGEARETARNIKRFYPNCKIVIGGHHPTAQPTDVLSWDETDYIICGEGEISMPLLAKAIKQNFDKDQLETIPGIGYRKQNGSFFINKPAILENLEDAPLPALDFIKNKYYRRHKKGAMVVTASRGCPMTCSYCSFGSGAVFLYRKRPIPSIIKEIELGVSKHQVRFIDFEDENLSLDKHWFLDLLNEIQLKFKGMDIELRAMNGMYPPSLDEDIVSVMKSAGFNTLNLSLGSINSGQLKRFKRPDVKQDFERALVLAKTYGMDAVGYIIAGAPEQKPKESLSDLLYFADKRVLAGLSVYYPSPGSMDYLTCKNNNLLPKHNFLMRSSTFPISHTTLRTESVTLLRLARILNFLKSLVDDNITLPKPDKFDSKFDPEIMADRRTMGIKFIQWFLADGKIRGCSKQGNVYEHKISESLTQCFIEQLDLEKIRGCRE